jgi:hypothetical protein
MDKNGEIPWSCLAPDGAWKAEIWHTSDETAVLARRRGSSDLRLPDAAPIRQCSTSDGSTTGARAVLILTESVGDSRIGIILIQHVSWNGGQLAWRELILLICVSGLWRQFCAACRAGQWRCVSKLLVSIYTLLKELGARGVTVSCDTLWRFLRREGFSFKKKRRGQRARAS